MEEREREIPLLEVLYIVLNAFGAETILFKIDVKLIVAVIEDLRKPLIVQGKRIDTRRSQISCIHFVVDVVAQIVKSLFRLRVLIDETFFHTVII